MLELTGFDVVFRGIGVLYWLLAIGAISVAVWLNETPTKKIVWATVVAFVFGFWPAKMLIEHSQRQTYAREAWAYFKKKCATEAGEKIYKTFTGVKSVLVVKPLPPATERDLYDQFWYGDPYSDATPIPDRGISAARRLVTDWKSRNGSEIQRGLDSVEIKAVKGAAYTRILRPVSPDQMPVFEQVNQSVSKFGVIWEDISTPEDRSHWVAGGRFRVVDLTNNSVVAERIGYLIEPGFGSTAGQRRPWLAARGIGPNGRSCPESHDATDQWFITAVFK